MKKFLEKNRDLFAVRTENGTLTLLGLLWPLLLENVLRNLMSTVNTALLGRFDEGAVSAVGIASQILNLVLTIHWVISGGASVVISQNLGAGNRKKAAQVATVTLVFVGFLSVAISAIVYIFAEPLLLAMNLAPELLDYGMSYLRITTAFSFFEGIIMILSAIARSYGDTKSSMVVMITMNVLNAIGSYIVIMRPFETPFVGVAGVAWLKEISIIIAFIFFLFLLKNTGLQLDGTAFRAKPFSLFWEVLRIGIPQGVSFISYNFAQIVSMSFVAAIGMSAVAAMQYVNNIVMYVSMAGSSLGTANGIMLGYLVGSGEFDRAQKVNNINLRMAMSFNAILSIILFIFRFQILQIFSPEQGTLELAASVLFIDIFVEIGRAMNNIGDAALSSSGDVRYSMILNIASCWCFSILFSYIFGIRMGMGLYGCWISFMMDELFRGIMNAVRWKSRKWIKYAESMRQRTAV